MRDPSEPWMQVYSGAPFYPLTAQPEDIEITDIAHALGMVCRYAGHCRRFYSVAEHCWLLSYSVDQEHALTALLHDATEAYMGDLVRPLKNRMPDYKAVEDRLWSVIADRFNLPEGIPQQVKEYDTRIVADEREQIMAPSRLPWTATEGYAPLGVYINGWSPITAGEKYLARFHQLTAN